MICSSIPASAPAARTARACRSASASRRCGWSASPWEGLDERGAYEPNIEELARTVGPDRRDRRRRFPGQGCAGRTVLRALVLDGADAVDRRRHAGDQISLWLWRRLAADTPRLSRDG